MDYMALVNRSFNNAWKHKFLWLFGFFVAAGGNGVVHVWDTDKDCDWGDRFGICPIDFEPAFIIMAVMAAFALWIVFWVMSVLSESALIRGIADKELNQPTNFGLCWSVGLNKFFRLFGIILLATLAAIFAILCMAMVIVPAYIAAVGLGIVLTVLAIPFLVVIIFIATAVEGWAIRYAVLYDDKWLDALGRGWNMLKNNVGKSIGVAISSFLAQLVLWCVLVICCLVLAIPFVIIGYTDLWLGLIPGLIVAIIVIILASAFTGTFASSMWTLGFMQMTGYSGQQPAAATETAPPLA